MNNPRFPHTCKISRQTGDAQDGDLTDNLIYNGSCRKELDKFNDSHYQNTANTSQWILSLPIEVKVLFGDTVLVDDGIADIKGVVSDWEVTNITHYNEDGVFQKDADGNVTSLFGTTTKGMHLYVSVTKN
jgi:hypothetical protein